METIASDLTAGGKQHLLKPKSRVQRHGCQEALMMTKVRVSAVVALSIPLATAQAEKPRIYLTESSVLQVSGDALVGETKGSLSVSGGSSPQTVEVMKQFLRRCPQVSITGNQDKADYLVRFDHEEASPVTPFVRGNKVAILDKQQDLVFSGSTRFLANAVKDACSAIIQHSRK
jgi:hypothetical protein